MTAFSILEASNIYDVLPECEIVQHSVDHAGLSAYSSSLRAFSRGLLDQDDDDFWRAVLGPIRRLAFALCSTPLPFTDVAKALSTDWARVDRLVRQCRDLYPDSFARLEELVAQLKQLVAKPDSPLLPTFLEIVQRNRSAAVLLQNPRCNRQVIEFLASDRKLRHVDVVSATQLKASATYENLVVIGPCGWFPDYVFTSPRARMLHVISFRWIRDTWTPGPLFLSANGDAERSPELHSIGRLPRMAANNTHSQNGESLAASEILPIPRSHTSLGRHFTGTNENLAIEATPARPCHLGETHAVFVSADDGATALIIDTAQTGNLLVRRVLVEQLEAGMFLLLRTGRGGDFVAPLADKLLDARCAELRAMQVQWKRDVSNAAASKLGAQDRRQAAQRIREELERNTGLTFQSPNVHYWLSPKCIRPRSKDDFVALLTFADSAERAEATWAAMGEIDSAHRRAGHLIRRMLLRTIDAAALALLERDGEMTFELGEQGGGSLSAFRITMVGHETLNVDSDRLGVLIDLEDDLWQE